jgi:hypothetical protein
MSTTKLTLLETIIKPFPFVNWWVEKRVKAREDALALLQNEKESMVTKAYENARTLLIDTSAKFNPQRDIGYIQYMQKEYETVIEWENQFKKNQWSLIEQILVIFVALWLLKTETKYTQTSSTLLDDLHWFLQDAEAAKQIMTLWLPELPKTSGQYIAESIRVYEEHRQMIQTALQQMNTRITPEKLEEQLLDVFCSKDREQWTVSAERELSKEWIDMVREYRKLYEIKYQEIERRWDAAEQERKQLVVLLIKEAKSTWVTQWVALHNQWNELHVGDLSDNELEEYGEKIQKQQVEMNDDQENREKQWGKLEHMMHQLLFPEWLTVNQITWRNIKYENECSEWITINDEVKKRQDESKIMSEQLQKHIVEIQQEQTKRAFEKMKEQRKILIERLMDEYEVIQEVLLQEKNEEIGTLEKTLSSMPKKTSSTYQNLFQILTKALYEIETMKWTGDFVEQCKGRMLEKYPDKQSKEYFLIDQWALSATEQARNWFPEQLAKQEQEGKKLSELTLSTISKEETDRIATYRTDWMTQISNTDKEKNELKQIADAMIAKWEFKLEQKAWITWGRFTLWWFNKAFGTTDFQIKNNENDPDDIFNTYEYDNKVLSKWKRHLTRLKAMKSNKTEERKEPLKTQMKARESQGVGYDHAGDMKTLIQIIQKEKWVSERDALAIYMYLTGHYGRYRTWQIDKNGNRGCVYLDDYFRRFNSFGLGNFSASLLLSW